MDIQKVKQQFNIIGNSPLLNRGIEIAMQVSVTDLSVLITGESGVGKEHFPKIIHHYSVRKSKPYIAINCGAIPEGTIDSELFGHEKGSFTDARSERKGYFEMADGGTLFLDEVGELPLSTQARLLRVLETGEYMRVGSSKVLKADVRVVAATNLNIPRAIEEGKFREDLYYRLNTIGIRIPSLRERREDIPLLFRKFARDFADRYHMPSLFLTDEAVEMVKNYYWRGNVRQLKNVVDQMSILEQRRDITPSILANYLPKDEQSMGLVTITRGGDERGNYDNQNIEVLKQIVMSMGAEIENLKLQVKKLQEGIVQPNTNSLLLENKERIDVVDGEAEEVQPDPVGAPVAIIKTKAERDMEAIIQALEKSGGNRKVAAELLGMSERTLYRKLKGKKG
jgi:DNA-binding NtrC family response regulator